MVALSLNRGMKVYPLIPRGLETLWRYDMPFTLSQNTAREIETAFQAFQKSETLAAGQFSNDMHDVHIPAATAYSFLRDEAEAAGVSLSSSSLWKGTSFAGKDHKDYRAFMAIVADSQKDILAMIEEKNITSWRYALQAWKKANREAKETVEETWEDALLKLLDKFDLDPADVAEYLVEMVDAGTSTREHALDVTPLAVIDPAKAKTKTKTKAA